MNQKVNYSESLSSIKEGHDILERAFGIVIITMI